MSYLSQKKSLKTQYKVICTIGQGAFGSVKLAYHHHTGTREDIKTVDNIKKQCWFIMPEMVTPEILPHPYIITVT